MGWYRCCCDNCVTCSPVCIELSFSNVYECRPDNEYGEYPCNCTGLTLLVSRSAPAGYPSSDQCQYQWYTHGWFDYCLLGNTDVVCRFEHDDDGYFFSVTLYERLSNFGTVLTRWEARLGETPPECHSLDTTDFDVITDVDSCAVGVTLRARALDPSECTDRILPCIFADDCDTRQEIQVVIAGIAVPEPFEPWHQCADCADWNGTYILQRADETGIGQACLWRYTRESPLCDSFPDVKLYLYYTGSTAYCRVEVGNAAFLDDVGAKPLAVGPGWSVSLPATAWGGCDLAAATCEVTML